MTSLIAFAYNPVGVRWPASHMATAPCEQPINAANAVWFNPRRRRSSMMTSGVMRLSKDWVSTVSNLSLCDDRVRRRVSSDPIPASGAEGVSSIATTGNMGFARSFHCRLLRSLWGDRSPRLLLGGYRNLGHVLKAPDDLAELRRFAISKCVPTSNHRSEIGGHCIVGGDNFNCCDLFRNQFRSAHRTIADFAFVRFECDFHVRLLRRAALHFSDMNISRVIMEVKGVA